MPEAANLSYCPGKALDADVVHFDMSKAQSYTVFQMKLGDELVVSGENGKVLYRLTMRGDEVLNVTPAPSSDARRLFAARSGKRGFNIALKPCEAVLV